MSQRPYVYICVTLGREYVRGADGVWRRPRPNRGRTHYSLAMALHSARRNQRAGKFAWVEYLHHPATLEV